MIAWFSMFGCLGYFLRIVLHALLIWYCNLVYSVLVGDLRGPMAASLFALSL